MVYRSREVQATDGDLGVSSTCVVFKAMEPGEITKGMSGIEKRRGPKMRPRALPCVEVGRTGQITQTH